MHRGARDREWEQRERTFRRCIYQHNDLPFTVVGDNEAPSYSCGGICIVFLTCDPALFLRSGMGICTSVVSTRDGTYVIVQRAFCGGNCHLILTNPIGNVQHSPRRSSSYETSIIYRQLPTTSDLLPKSSERSASHILQILTIILSDLKIALSH